MISAMFTEGTPTPASTGPVTVRVIGRTLLRAAVEALLGAADPSGRIRVQRAGELDSAPADVILLLERDGCESFATESMTTRKRSAGFLLMSSTRHTPAEMEAGFIAARQLGVSAFVGDEDTAEVLIQAVQKAAQGEWYCSPTLFPLIMRCLCEGHAAAPAAAASASSQFATAPAAPAAPRRRETTTAAVAVAMPAPPVPALVFASTPSSRKRTSEAPAPREGEALSPREREISLQAVQGMSNAEIAAALDLSIATVKFHLSNIFEKLGIVRRSQLAWALQQRQSQDGRRRSGSRSTTAEGDGLRPFLQVA